MQGDNNQVTSVDATMTSRKRKLPEDSAETSTPDSHDIRSSEPGQLDAATLAKSNTLSHDGHETCAPGSLEETPQNVHAPIVEAPNPKQNSFPATVFVKSGHTQEYHGWWQQAQNNTRLFGAHLVGDVQQPSLVSSMSLTDLAFCSTWGCNRVQEHQSLAPLQLILPVLTDPEVVQHAVAAIHSGSTQLSMCNVEAVLVLANSIGVECLESACIQYLCSKAPEMQQMSLLRVAKLGNHLGLAKLCEAAAEALVQLPWKDCMSDLAEVTEMPVYKLNLGKKRQLLHHSKRGAFAELQVLELLEHTGTPETDIAHICKLQASSLRNCMCL